MGQRGPLPQPDLLKALRGNPGKRPLNLDEGLQPAVVVPDPPDWLNVDAALEWSRLTAELAELGIVAEIDLATLAVYCQTWGDLCALERAWAAKRRALEEKAPDQPDAVTLHLHTVTTPTGFKRNSPIYDRMRELRADLERMARNFGGSAASRSRIQPSERPPEGDDPPPAAGQVTRASNVKNFDDFR